VESDAQALPRARRESDDVGDVAGAPNRGSAVAAALFEELSRAGVAHVCVCPGSRSALLAIAAVRSGLPRSTHLDERSAGFFALGLAKAARAPVALVCTSGTAAVNVAPAVVEAAHARVPLLVLTADRPPELREWGAGQTIDQSRLYGSHVRWFVEASLPEASGAGLRYVRALASRAVQVARGAPAGPVHLNLPFREPLDPTPVPGDVAADLAAREPLAARGRPDTAYTAEHRGRTLPSPDEVASLALRLGGHERGVVVCGPLDAPDAAPGIAALAARLGWPLLAEATSQLRTGPHMGATPLVVTGDWLLRDPEFARRHAPDAVLRFGAPPTSKALRLWLERRPPAELVVVDPDGGWGDPSHLASAVHRAPPEALCDALLRRLPDRAPPTTAWLASFLAADRAAARALDTRLAREDALVESRAVRELAAALPADAILYVSNSMPVRDLDGFWPAAERGPRILCNRGANGIDGMVSSALGAAACGAGRVVLLAGDLALLHDVSGLLAAVRLRLPLTIVVFDNDGGGIFSHLPVAGFGARAAFRESFHTPHGHDLEALCRGAGARATRVGSWEHLRAALKESLETPAGDAPSVVVVPLDAQRDAALVRDAAREVGAALAETRSR